MKTIRVGNAPCSWGTLEFESLESKRISHEQMLDELKETGYEGTDLGDWGFMPTAPDLLRDALARRQLAMISAFVPMTFKYRKTHAEGESYALRVARLLSRATPPAQGDRFPMVVLADDNGTDSVRTKNAGRITPQMSMSDEEWRVFADGVNRVARAIRVETGLRTVFHPHCGGFVETPAEIDRLVALTDPEMVGLVFDTGHYAYGAGADGCGRVLDGLNRLKDRVWLVHFKDCDPNVAAQARAQGWNYFEAVGHGLFCELGKGCVDFSAVTESLRQANYDGWVTVEQDVLPGLGTPKESAARNRAYLRGIGL
ncbi:MAG: sugar phosphate isomerase/epimerase [Anaerolineae bacterium]